MSTGLPGFPDLPNEIVLEIFLRCLPSSPYHHPDPREAPLLLTHVCSPWREFTSQFPDLWKSILLSDGNKELSLAQAIALRQRLMDQVALWKSNSRGHPLGISLEIGSADIEDEGRDEEETSEGSVNTIGFWDTLLDRAIVENPEQLQKLHLQFNLVKIGKPIHAISNVNMSKLESLQIMGQPHWTSEPANLTITSFAQASNLRRITLGLGNAPSNHIKMDLPWAQLTHVVLLHSTTSSIFHFIITECPILQILALHLSVNYSQDPPVSAPPAQTAIQELLLEFDYVDDISFLSSTTFPLLRKFRFRNTPGLGDPQLLNRTRKAFPGVYNHLINQLHLLHSLTLAYHKIACDDLLDILRQTPLLVELVVDSELGDYSNFLQALTYKPGMGDTSLLPKLETFSLYIEITSGMFFSNVSFFNMIISRSNLGIHSTQGSCGGLTHRPACLKNVFLCIEKTDQEHPIPILDYDDVASRVEDFIKLDSGVTLTLDISDSVDKRWWLEEDIVIW